MPRKLKFDPNAILASLDKYGKATRMIFLLLLVLPVFFIETMSYFGTRRSLTEGTYSRRQAIAQSASVALSERLGRLRDLGISLATRVHFQQLVSERRWEQAIKIMESTVADFPMIDRIFIADPEGFLRADTSRISQVRGKNFAYQDWYKGVSRNWEIYVSRIYKRFAEPRYLVLSVAAPIKDQGKVAGVLVLQLRIDRVFEWAKGIDVGPSGYVYFVDRLGGVAAHPGGSPTGEILNFSGVPIIQKVLHGLHGVEISVDPVEKVEELAAYEPVPAYGWGVIVQQPAAVAFASQNESLRFLLFVYGLILAVTSVTAYLILRSIESIRARSEAEKQVALRDEFIAVASHELRTPLSALIIQLQIIPKLLESPEKAGSDAISGLLKRSLKQLDQFAKLVEELLDVSRVSVGRLVLNPQRVDLSRITRDVVDKLQNEFAERGCAVVLSLREPLLGYWDPVRIEQVVMNLIMNAMKYGAGKPIEITTQAEAPATARLVVRDHGIGITPEDQPRIFERFERAAPVARFRGLGLGLYITKQILLAHGGTIRVESEGLNRGSAFIAELPLRGEGRGSSPDLSSGQGSHKTPGRPGKGRRY